MEVSRNDLSCVEWDVKLLHYYYYNELVFLLLFMSSVWPMSLKLKNLTSFSSFKIGNTVTNVTRQI